MTLCPRSVVLICLVWCGFTRAAGAQLPAAAVAGDSVLAALVQEALQRNPAVQASEEALRAARSRPGQAQALPNPMFSVQYTNDGISPSLGEQDMTTLAFMLSQDLPYPGKRGLSGEMSRRDADVAAEQLARVKLGVTASVRRAYAALGLARELLDVVHEQGEIWKQIEGVARSRYSVGQASQQEVLRAQVEVTRIAELQVQQEVEAQIQLAELNQLLARPPEATLERRGPLALRPLQGDFAAWFDTLRSVSPEVRAARLGVERERLALRLAKKASRPDLTLQAGYMNRGGLDPMWQAGLGVSLPVSNSRPKGATAEAEALLRSSDRTVESIELRLRLRTQQRVAQLRATERIADLYSRSIIPQDRLSVDAAISNYRVGSTPFVSVLEALSTWFSDRSMHVKLAAQHEMLRANLAEASLGGDAGMPAGLPAAGAAGPAAAGGADGMR